MSKPPETHAAKRAAPRCPMCRKKPADPAHTPFCSAVCRDRDLLKWLSEDYRVPGRPADEEDDTSV